MFILSINTYHIFRRIKRNAPPYLIFRDLFIILFSWQPHVPVDPKMIYSHENISFFYVLFVLHIFYIPFYLCESEYYIECEIVQCKIYIFNLSLCPLPIYYRNIMAD